MNLRSAVDYYSIRNYELITVPTLVGAEAINSTCPPDGDFVDDKEGNLHHVASAEQSFVQLLLDGEDLYGKYQAVTACHRPGDFNKGNFYQEWFLKLELYNSDPDAMLLMMNDVRGLYEMHLGDEIEIVSTPQGLDFYYNDIEIGSYGKRKYKGFEWTYGTGFVPYRLGICRDIVSLKKGKK